ncbi:MAG: ABC transporter permease [Actinomycetota bacterium]|nr:ABC transporter permease [Actinomycetota bacterium]
MLVYVLRRLLYTIPVLFATSLIIFTFVTVSGDPLTTIRVIPNLSQVTVDNLIEAKHLEDPLLVQYWHWLESAVTDKFGNTLLSDEPIWPDLTRVLGNTLQLILGATILSVLIAIFVGVISAVRQYSIFDYSSTAFSFFGLAMPVFWLGLILQIIFTNIYLNYGVRIFYTAQLSSPNPENWLIDRVQHLMLPVLTLAFIGVAQYSRYMRASMLEVINSDYVRTARAKGLYEKRVIMKHAFRNALIPLVTVVALDFGALFGGAFATESVFALDGMGLYFLRAIGSRDVYPVMAWLMVTAVIVITFNLIADVIYGYLDPRIRYD